MLPSPDFSIIYTLYCYTEVGTYICTAAHADGQQVDFWPYADSPRLGVGTISQDYSIRTADCRNLAIIKQADSGKKKTTVELRSCQGSSPRIIGHKL